MENFIPEEGLLIYKKNNNKYDYGILVDDSNRTFYYITVNKKTGKLKKGYFH